MAIRTLLYSSRSSSQEYQVPGTTTIQITEVTPVVVAIVLVTKAADLGQIADCFFRDPDISRQV